MEVVRSSFKGALPLIESAIEQADFIAFDTELTGLSTKYEQIDTIDSPQERYAKLKSAALKFQVLQWGLCTYSWDSENNRFVAKPFNFYLWRKSFQPQHEYYFTSQVSSLTFLASNNFDFNKTIYEGIPYLRREEESYWRSRGFGAQNVSTSPNPRFGSPQSPQQDIVITLDKDKDYIADVIKKVENLLESNETSISLEPTNAFQRRLVYQEIRKVYPTVEISSKNVVNSYSRYLNISKPVSDLDRVNQKLQANLESEEELDSCIGFRKVLELIIKAKKPLVGHNLFLDLVHTLNMITNLPEQVSQFTLELNKMFPIIYDTKYIMAKHDNLSQVISNTGLGDAFKQTRDSFCENMPAIDLEDGIWKKYEEEGKYHEAGYDAFVTGHLFLKLIYWIKNLKNQKNFEENLKFKNYKKQNLLENFIGNKKTKEFSNKIFVMRSDLPFLNIGGEQPEADRANYFHFSGFGVEIDNRAIERAWQELGRIRIKWIDDGSCWVLLLEPKDKDFVVRYFEEKRENGSFFVVKDYESRNKEEAEQKSKRIEYMEKKEGEKETEKETEKEKEKEKESYKKKVGVDKTNRNEKKRKHEFFDTEDLEKSKKRKRVEQQQQFKEQDRVEISPKYPKVPPRKRRRLVHPNRETAQFPEKCLVS